MPEETERAMAGIVERDDLTTYEVDSEIYFLMKEGLWSIFVRLLCLIYLSFVSVLLF